MRRNVLFGIGAAVAAGVAARKVLAPGTRASRAARHAARTIGKRSRMVRSELKGAAYRLRGRRPDPDVADDVLADRVRSALGPVCRRLDVPHVHVMVHDHAATLHGSVPTDTDAHEIENAVLGVSGVHAVTSYLHLGLGSGDQRPSEGRRASHSEAYKRLVGAATRAGVHDEIATRAVRGVLATFVERIPEGERHHVLGHLPADVRGMAEPPQRAERAVGPSGVRTLEELDDVLSKATYLPADRAESVALAVLGELKSLVPEEAGDVAAVLPSELRDFWERAPAA